MTYGIFQGQPIDMYDGRSHVFMPGWLSRGNINPMLEKIRRVERFESLAHYCRERRPRSVCFYRTYALGDILMLMPIAVAFRRALEIPEPIRIVVENRFFARLSPLNRCHPDLRFLVKRGICDYHCDVHIDLNGALERDHHGGPESDRHRLDLYASAIGFDGVQYSQ